MRLPKPAPHDPARAAKFRQAAIVYLHYGILYLVGAWVLYQRELFPAARGPAWLWFAAGVAIAAIVIWGLWRWQNVWFARAIWLLVAMRLPTLVDGAFLGGAMEGIPPTLYLVGALVVLVNLWALARAAWDV